MCAFSAPERDEIACPKESVDEKVLGDIEIEHSTRVNTKWRALGSLIFKPLDKNSVRFTEKILKSYETLN